MATLITSSPARIKGGSFLIETRRPDEIFAPEDLSDQHKLIARTAQEFVDQEIVPRVKEIEEKKPGLLRELLKKAAEVGLCATDVPEKYGGLALDNGNHRLAVVTEEASLEVRWILHRLCRLRDLHARDRERGRGRAGYPRDDRVGLQ